MVDLSNAKVGDILITRGNVQVKVCYISQLDKIFPITVSNLPDDHRYTVSLNGFRYGSNEKNSSDIVGIIGSKEIEFKPLAPTEDDTERLWDAMPDMATREEFLGYCKLSVIKHVSRYNKNNGIIDLKKAVAYCERMIRFLEEEQK